MYGNGDTEEWLQECHRRHAKESKKASATASVTDRQEEEMINMAIEMSLAEAQANMSETECANLEEWMGLPLDDRLQRIHDAAGGFEDGSLAGISFEEQMRIARERSKNEQKATRDEDASRKEDEELKVALEKSLKPEEQQSKEDRDLVRAITASLDKNSSIIPQGAAAAADVSVNDEDEDLKQAKKLSMQQQLLEQTTLELNTRRIEKMKPGSPRLIVIDGNNVAWTHGKHLRFSARGILLVWMWFLERGHTDIQAYYTASNIDDKEMAVCKDLEQKGILQRVMGRKMPDGKWIGHYDDLVVLEAANRNDGIVVSNDHFRDIKNAGLINQIKLRVLSFQFCQDDFIPAADPLGRTGPHLDDFLLYR